MSERKKRLAIVTSHPIQYNAPWFKLLANSSAIHPGVFYTWEQSAAGPKYDPDFKERIEWDIPLLEGYEYRFVKNEATDPGTHHFRGLINPTLNAEIAAWRPDALLVFGWSFDSHLKCLRHFHRKLPILFRGDSTLLDERPGLRQKLRRWFLKWIYSHIDYALYVGTNNKEYFLKHGLRERQLVYAPHAIDNSRFAEPDDRYRNMAAEWRGRLGIAADDLVLLFAGKLEPKKDPSFLLEVAGRIPDPRLKIVYAGTGLLEARLREAAKADGRIHFIGFQNQRQMPVVYRLGDIYILPSRGPGETWGLGVNEAMASGCAIMMSEKAGGSVDLVEEGVNGIRFDPASADGLEKCSQWARRLLDDPALLAGMKKASRRRIAAFSYEQLMGALLHPGLL
ncbi:MAG TPA: glycosyltransferase family 4 protein [Puia sp.]|jgi:glycosyltransferase involved in cell wall biosynthesis|nr:glycosyltransferase family 4 protein [Puia sp.]